jgi:hypothetical protein
MHEQGIEQAKKVPLKGTTLILFTKNVNNGSLPHLRAFSR